jgi:hypothetical protein
MKISSFPKLKHENLLGLLHHPQVYSQYLTDVKCKTIYFCYAGRIVHLTTTWNGLKGTNYYVGDDDDDDDDDGGRGGGCYYDDGNDNLLLLGYRWRSAIKYRDLPVSTKMT